MEENKVATDSSAPNSPELTRLSGEQAEERTAREGRKDSRFPSPPYYVSKECKFIPEAVDKELTRLDEENEMLRQREGARDQWLRYIKKIHVVWEGDGEGRSRIYEVTSCYPDMAIPDGSFVFHVKKPE